MSKDAWLRKGLALLRAWGEGALTLDRLAKAMRRTKGSFYHHFAGQDDFRRALLASWEEDLTSAPIRAAAAIADPLARATALSRTVRALDQDLDLAVRAWSLRDPVARAAFATVDARRLEAIEAIHAASGAANPRELAIVEYLAFVGWQQLRGTLPPDLDAADLVRRATAALAEASAARHRRSRRTPRSVAQ
ncbi:MAG: TetR family transcriptional regulator [Polyangiaceae bacterium]|nr:TetR family transcriptional regulator [Polyangiaceae bacterium]